MSNKTTRSVAHSAVPQTTIDPPMPRRVREPMIGLTPEPEEAAQEESAALEGLIVEYAVTSARGLNLRDRPSLDGKILAVLPFDAGVYSYSQPGDGWLLVRSGRLEGWVRSEYLEELPLPELSACDPE